MGHIHVKFTLFSTSGSGDVCKDFLALVSIMFGGAEPFVQFW